MNKSLRSYVKDKISHISKYAFVGINGTIIDVGLLALLVDYFHVRLGFATAIAFIVAVIHNFIFNKYWTFKDNSDQIFHQYIKFLLVSIAGFIMTMALMYLLSITFGVWYIFSKLLTSLVVLSWNFIANYHWTFKSNVTVPYKDERVFEYSIIIPAYNEAKRIIKTLKQIIDYFNEKQISVEIIVVDDGSSDNTVEVVDDYFAQLNMESSQNSVVCNCIGLEKNYGKGKAVKTGVLMAKGEFVLYMDADGSTSISEISKLREQMCNADIVIGSRTDLSIIKNKQPIHRKMIGEIGKLCTKLLIRDIRDTQCGFKLFKAEIAYDLFNQVTINRFGFDIEMLVLARIAKYRVIEVPVQWSHVGFSNVRPIVDSILSFRDVVCIYFNYLIGKYR